MNRDGYNGNEPDTHGRVSSRVEDLSSEDFSDSHFSDLNYFCFGLKGKGMMGRGILAKRVERARRARRKMFLTSILVGRVGERGTEW